jgi:hypothetical protein
VKKTKKPAPPSAEQRLEWLLEFLQRDVTALRPGERLDLGTDVVRFLLAPAVIVPTAAPDGYAIALAKMKGETVPEAPAPTLTDEALLTLQTALRAGVELLSAGLRWSPAFETQPPIVFEPREDGTIIRRYVASLANGLLISAADLLVDTWPRLRRCAFEPCRVLFQPEHGRQKYHDPKCSALARWHRLPKGKRDYKQELANAERRDRLKATRHKLEKGKTS